MLCYMCLEESFNTTFNMELPDPYGSKNIAGPERAMSATLLDAGHLFCLALMFPIYQQYHSKAFFCAICNLHSSTLQNHKATVK